MESERNPQNAALASPPHQQGYAHFKTFDEKYEFVKESFYYDCIEGAVEGMSEGLVKSKTLAWNGLKRKLESKRYFEGIVKPAQLEEEWEAALRAGLEFCDTEDFKFSDTKDFKFSDELDRLFVGTLRHLYENCDWGAKPHPETYEAFEQELESEAESMCTRNLRQKYWWTCAWNRERSLDPPTTSAGSHSP